MNLTIFYGTETGNCEELAEKVAAKGNKLGVTVTVKDLADLTVDALSTLNEPLLVIISTWDDGMPPPKAAPFCEQLFDSSAKLDHLSFCVLALGDKDFPLYCECGRMVDAKLAELGATKIMERGELDADFPVSFIGWSKSFWNTMASLYGVAA